MRENWIEEVLVDLSKSALNEGRVELFDAIKGLVKIAVGERAAHSKDLNPSRAGNKASLSTAEVIDLYDYRRRLEK